MITADGINMLESYIKSIVDHVEMRIGDTWYKASNTDVSVVTAKDKVTILGTAPKEVLVGETIEEVRVIAVNGATFCKRDVSIKRASNGMGFMYSCEIFISATEIFDSAD